MKEGARFFRLQLCGVVVFCCEYDSGPMFARSLCDAPLLVLYACAVHGALLVWDHSGSTAGCFNLTPSTLRL